MNLSIHHIPLGVYIPGDSFVHKLGAGTKLLSLIAILVGMNLGISLPNTIGALGGAGFVLLALLGYLLAQIPRRVALGQLLSPLPLIIFFGLLLAWRSGWQSALASVLTLYASVALATLITLTTQISALMDALARALRPFERFGLPVDTITFSFSLCLRLIPLIFITALEVLEAQKARGITGMLSTIKAFGVPLIVRCLVRTKALGEAMLSRGLGD